MNLPATGKANDRQTMSFQQHPKLKPTTKTIKQRGNKFNVVYLLSSDWSDLKSVRRLPSLIVPPSWPGWCSGISIIYNVTGQSSRLQPSAPHVVRVNVSHPTWYNMVISDMLFQSNLWARTEKMWYIYITPSLPSQCSKTANWETGKISGLQRVCQIMPNGHFPVLAKLLCYRNTNNYRCYK